MTWRPGDGRRRVEGAGQLPEVVFDAPGWHPGAAKQLQQFRIEAAMSVLQQHLTRGGVAEPDRRVAERDGRNRVVLLSRYLISPITR